MTEMNPYQGPRADVTPPSLGDEPELANIWTRLGAVMLDGLFYIPPMIPGMFGFISWDPEGAGDPPIALFAISGVLILGLFAYNLTLLNQNGWTLGKKFLGIRIVRADYDRATLGRIFGLRMMVPALIGSIPLMGSIFQIADPLFIFRQDRRTIHDMIADTIVVVAEPR